MDKKITVKMAVERLRQEKLRAGGVRPLAREWGMSASMISEILNGYRPPTPRILGRLGLEWVLRETKPSDLPF